jgi:hypothetical protein
MPNLAGGSCTSPDNDCYEAFNQHTLVYLQHRNGMNWQKEFNQLMNPLLDKENKKRRKNFR